MPSKRPQSFEAFLTRRCATATTSLGGLAGMVLRTGPVPEKNSIFLKILLTTRWGCFTMALCEFN